MKFSATILIPDVRLLVTNAEQTVTAMTSAVERNVVTRTERGQDAHGAALPRAKDAGTEANPDGRPLHRSGHMIAGIGSVVRTGRGGVPEGVVRAFGDRPATEGGAAKVARAKVKTAAMRRTEREEARRDGRKVRRVRVRGVQRNADLAAVLSQPPRDVRSRNGGRAQYRVFERSEADAETAADVARKMIRVRLVQVGTKEIK